ncbi:MAG: hypothetical protein AAGE84_00570 [Cyanobacteria bacterium P01_G01_bin.39]
MNIVSGFTPIVAFGNPHNCRVATIGINPSKNEFSDRFGQELTEDKRRLETLNSLGIKSIDSTNKLQVGQIWSACNNYFHKNPYYWFNKLQKVLTYFEVSYDKNTACHLDLVQWATDPVWGKINNKIIKHRLIEKDRIFLRKQIENENF